MIQATQENRSGWSVVVLQGRADATGAEPLAVALCTEVERQPKVAAQFAGVDYISSAGLRGVLKAAKLAQSKGVEFIICAPTPAVRKVFELSGLEKLLRIVEDLPC